MNEHNPYDGSWSPTPARAGGFYGAEAEPEAERLRAAMLRIEEVLLRNTGRLVATVSELAEETGIEAGEVFDLLGRYINSDLIMLEYYGDHIFIHPRDLSTSGVGEGNYFPPNLWGHLRRRLDEATAYKIWMLIRDMEKVGWSVEVRPGHSVRELGPVRKVPLFGVYVRNRVLPVLVFPDPEALGGPDGLLSTYERADADDLAIVCYEGALDETVTAIRAWLLQKNYHTSMGRFLILEEPRYDPVIVNLGDGSVTPASDTFMADYRSTV